MDSNTEQTHAITLAAPSGNGELHQIRGAHGIVVDSDTEKTTNRAYFHTRGPLELTAAECRELASTLELAAEQLDKHHDVRMPIDRDASGETGENHG